MVEHQSEILEVRGSSPLARAIPSWSSRKGRRSLKAEVTGSSPVLGTQERTPQKVRVLRAAPLLPPTPGMGAVDDALTMACNSTAEWRIVNPLVVGSSPTRPALGLAQWQSTRPRTGLGGVGVAGSTPVSQAYFPGRGLRTLPPGRGAVGSVPDLDSGSRRFEPCRSDHHPVQSCPGFQ